MSATSSNIPDPGSAVSGSFGVHPGDSYLKVLELLDVGVVVQDRHLNIVFANAKAESLLGITTHEITSRTTVDERWDVVGPDGRPIADDGHPGPRAMRTGRAVQGVVLGVRRGDAPDRVWLLASAVPEYDAEGHVDRVVISFSDVSIAQRTLREHEATYHAVFRSMAEGLVIHNVDGSIRAANASAERVLGLSVEQMTGRHPMDPEWRLILPDGSPAGPEHIPSEITSRTGVSSTAILGVHRPDGALAWLEVNAQPLREPGDDSMSGVLATFADITAERRAIDALEANRAQLQRVLDGVPGMVYQFLHRPDRGGRLTFAAGAIRDLTGLAPDEVRANPHMVFGLIDEASTPLVWEAIDASSNALTPFEQVLPFRHASGEQRWARVYGVPQQTADGVLYTGVVLDATRERLMSEALRRSQRREAMGDMAGGIAHNFNNMLAVILPNVQLARDLATEEVSQHLADAERAARSASDLVKRMLALGRAELRENEQVDLVPIVNEALHICRQTFDRSIDITDGITVREAWVRASASNMQQVVLNLLLNARDAMAGLSPQRLHVQLESVPATEQSAAQARLTVRDTGVGMSPDTLRRIGEPFFTTKAPGSGTGLGLASAFHSISDSGGSWRVESAPGQGTVFIVDLPLASAGHQRFAAPPADSKGGALQGTVLVVDDEPMVRAVLTRQLTHAGMQAVSANGADEALSLLRGGELTDLAVILLDLSMPGMSGEQALPLLRAAAPGTPVLALSGHVSDDISLPGVAAVLQKPMGQRELVEAVRHAIDEAGRRRTPG